MRRLFLQRNEGQAIVLAALAFIVLVGALGLALDGANAYNQRRNANNAADAAAMAGTRALLEANQNNGKNRDVYQAVQTYLDSHLPTSSGTTTWNAYYIDRNGNQIGGAIPNNGGSVEQIDISDSTRVRGIAVDIQFTFKTFFMPLLGRNTLTVAGYGLGLVGPLGGATGPDLVPLAIRDEAAQEWQRSSDTDKNQAWSMMVYTDTVDIDTPPRTIRKYNLKHISLKPDGSSPAFGTTSNCDSISTTEDSLVYWWCKGTAYQMTTGEDAVVTLQSLPPSDNLKDEIQWRISNRPDVLMPVYNRGTNNTLVGFIAIHLTQLTPSGILKGKIISYYTAPGPISGQSTGFFDTYAINLVR